MSSFCRFLILLDTWQDTTTSTNKDGGSGTSPQSRGTDSRKHSDVVSADGRSITSDTRSYREKIRDRISMVKVVVKTFVIDTK